jgi:hypothetical protein
MVALIVFLIFKFSMYCIPPTNDILPSSDILLTFAQKKANYEITGKDVFVGRELDEL